MNWIASYTLFYYKFRLNISDTSYEELRRIISDLSCSEHEIDIKSLWIIWENLRQILHPKIWKYDACIDDCMIFNDNHLLRRRYLYYKKARFVETSDNVEEFYTNSIILNSLTPKIIYSYIPIIPHLRLLYANKEYSKKMRYPRELMITSWINELSRLRDV